MRLTPRLKYQFLSLLAVLLSAGLFAQHEVDYPSEHKKFHSHQNDSIHSVKDFFTKGIAHGHIRNYTMATIHEGILADNWTNAIGGALRYETAEWNGLSFGVKGIFTFEAFGMDLTVEDENIGRSAKWEKELYDILRPGQTNDLDRLEELFARYSIGESDIRIGKIDINQGPLLLRRDGRMKPFAFRGAWAQINEFENHKIFLGYIDGVSPRGMTEWFSLDEAIGLLSNGRQPDGTPAAYHQHSGIDWIGVIGVQKEMYDELKLSVWNFLFDTNMDISWFQADLKHNSWIAGLQYVHQTALAEPEDIEYTSRYIQEDETADVISMRLGYAPEHTNWEFTTAYLHAFDNGRFLFPKELGRENFYVSHPRFWIDGMGDADVYMVQAAYETKSNERGQFKMKARLSRLDAPAQDDYRLNKYALPSIYQVMLFPKYEFHHSFKGVELGLLYVWKIDREEGRPLDEQFYRTDLHHLNLVMNIDF